MASQIPYGTPRHHFNVKMRVALGGINGGDPSSPYAKLGGILKIALSPFFMVATPSSQPLITSPGST